MLIFFPFDAANLFEITGLTFTFVPLHKTEVPKHHDDEASILGFPPGHTSRTVFTRFRCSSF
jgi:hypothetical protein